MGLMIAINFAALCITVTLSFDITQLKPYNVTAITLFNQEDHNLDGCFTLLEDQADFGLYDANGDGQESRKEYTTFVCNIDPASYQLSHYLFDEYDLNPTDHHLTLSDYDAFWNLLNTNGDGCVDQTEWITWWVALFTKLEHVPSLHQHGHSHEHGAHSCFAG